MTDKLFGHKTDIADVYGFEKYNVDLDLLRTNPELSTRRLLTTVTDIIGTVTHYKSYGVIMDSIDTTSPQSAINQYLKFNTTTTRGSFKEYRVQLFDRNPTRMKTVMQNCNDVLRGITLKVCSVSSQIDSSVLQPGMLVLVDYTNSSGKEGTIIEVLGSLPSITSEDTTEYDARVPFETEPCPDTNNVKPTSDPVNAPATGDVSRLRYTKVIESGPGYLIVELSDGTRVKKEGTGASRNNNPGNLRSSDQQIGLANHGKTGKFAIFATPEDGWAALNTLLFVNQKLKYYDKTIVQTIYTYAPPSENNTEQYIAKLEKDSGISRQTVLRDLNEAQRAILVKTIAKIEGFSPSKVKTTIIQGTTSAPTPTFTSPSCSPPQETVEQASPTDPNTEFSKYFTLRDLTKPSRGIPNIPDDEQTERLGYLARDILDALVEKFGKDSFVITSAFRSAETNNSIVGSAKNSQHMTGQAVDVCFLKSRRTDEDLFNTFEEIVKSNIPYDQLIFESTGPGSCWYHISIASSIGDTPFTTTRKQVLMHGPWTKSKAGGTYPPYNREIVDIRAKIKSPIGKV